MPRWETDLNLDRILDAVGTAVPAVLDREQLLSDLDGIASLYRTGVDVRHTPAKRRQNVSRIIAAAEHLKTLIENDWRLHRHWSALDRLIADAASEFPEGLMKMLGTGRMSAFENLIGLMLRTTFEQHFGEQAGYTRDPFTGDISGRFIDFAEAALEELGITSSDAAPYSRNAIAAALTKFVKMQNRA
jgi:hypothetical protein